MVAAKAAARAEAARVEDSVAVGTVAVEKEGAVTAAVESVAARAAARAVAKVVAREVAKVEARVLVRAAERAAETEEGVRAEEAPVAALFAQPRHRYTRALIDTMPAGNPPGSRLPSIAGMVPPPGARGTGCAFAPRCPAPVDRCAAERPALAALGPPEHRAACWNPAA
jgi:oligopeptide/dipeptide ABC transporter ATP-binding protein